MPPTTNILQFNPPQNNQDSDAAYSADSNRATGFPSGAGGSGVLVPSLLLNKVLYQFSTLAAAFAQFGVNQGQNINDTSLASLTAALEAFLATLNSPQLTGTPTTPTVGVPTDASLKIANSAFVQSAIAAALGSSQKLFKVSDNNTVTLSAATGTLNQVAVPFGIVNESSSIIQIKTWGIINGSAGAANPTIQLLIGATPILINFPLPGGDGSGSIGWLLDAEINCAGSISSPHLLKAEVQACWFNGGSLGGDFAIFPINPTVATGVGFTASSSISTSAAGVVIIGYGMNVKILQ